MQGDLSPTELFDMIEKTGNHVNRENLERIGLFYNFKKTPFPFHYTGKDHLGIRKMQKRTEWMLHLSQNHENTIRACGYKHSHKKMQYSWNNHIHRHNAMAHGLPNFRDTDTPWIQGISISTGEMSSLEFLLRFYCIHRRHMEDMELNEYILHRNETGESGSEIVFMAKDKYNVQTRTKNSMLELNTNEYW